MRPLLTLLARLRRRILLHRRVLAAASAGLAVLLLVPVFRPAPPTTVPVWVAARDLPAGATLARDDLRRVDWPGDLASPPRLDVEAVLDRTLVLPVSRGQPLGEAAVLGQAALRSHPGRVVVPIRIPDPAVVALLVPGDEIDLWLSDTHGDGEPRQVAAAARVVTVPAADDGPLAAAASTGRVVVLAVSEDTVGEVTTAASRGFLSVAWTR